MGPEPPPSAAPRVLVFNNEQFKGTEVKLDGGNECQPCAIRIQVAKEDPRVAIFEALQARPDISVLECNHGMTKTHVTKIAFFSSPKDAADFLALNRKAERSLMVADEHQLFSDSAQILTVFTARSDFIAHQLREAVQAEWIIPINHTSASKQACILERSARNSKS